MARPFRRVRRGNRRGIDDDVMPGLQFKIFEDTIIKKMEQVHIGHYILGKTIGTGGFAKVKEARHDLTGVKVAVKIINKRKMKNKNMISKVKRQIKILKFINHQNIIKLYEVLDTTNDIFVIMEYAEGGELYDYIHNHELSEQETKFFFRQIISGVGYAHFNLISHRDLKPENILIGSNKLIKIVDFGLSNLMKDGRLLKTSCGSPNYAAPEVVGQRKYEGTSVDIWSCGVILYAMLVGTLPFDGQTVSLLYKRIQQGHYTLPNDINPFAADLIHRMLQVDPYKRIRIYEIHNHPWLRSHIPIYSKIPIYFSLQKEQTFQLDQAIFDRVKQLSSATMSEGNDDKYKKAIKKHDDQSFVITYELLKDNRQPNKNSSNRFRQYVPINAILADVKNEITHREQVIASQFLYGQRFVKYIKTLLEIVIRAMNNLGIEFTVKNRDYCFKCRYIPETYKNSSNNNADNSDMDIEKELQSQIQQKYTKKQIKFMLQIYSVDVRQNQHMIDLQLTQGHPLVFFNVASKLYCLIQTLVSF